MSKLLRFLALLLVSIIWLSSCGGGSEKTVVKNNLSALSNKDRQYFTNGRTLYQSLCISCHMDSGEGLGKLIPPLKASDYLLGNVPAVSRVIKYGLKGPVTVNETEYNQPMPGNPRLTNLEIAEILTYISNSWGNEHGPVSIAQVAESLKEKNN
ncbi:MAG: cytochrome c [Roseivirga sp.]|nr:cytochrome c [Roseivirga sp.]